MDMVIDIEDLNKTFGKKQVLKNINIKIRAGEMVGLIGASGSGKSTLIRSIAGLETMDRTSKHIKIFSKPTQLGDKRTSNYRSLRQDVGIIFQQFNLVGRLSLLTNVLIGRLAHNASWKGVFRLFPRSERVKALEALERVNMVDYAHQRSSTLSGGQQQRGAIARALTQEAKLILADEPIASLDPASSDRVMNLLCDINNQDGTTVVVSLHQFEVATTRCERIIALNDGEIVYDGKASGISNADLVQLYGVEDGVCSLGAERPAPIMKAG
ncbi:phosphonate ABC transporter ATP-binding protein [uncultured Desulfuromusa sp.]|uniref:phosphonate ABC transporter ATP-binding protein n=1 Tax=uncultured Desulfuromusa sp. TaxID=219183 RepID=UPI003747D103